MTTDKRLKTYSCVATIIYVLLHTRYQFKSFVLTGEVLVIQVKKINY